MTLPESFVRDHFARQHGGCREVTLRFGRADVVTRLEVVEVEPFSRWLHGARQALAYGSELHLTPGLAIYGDMTRDDVRRMARKCGSLIALHVLDGSEWLRPGEYTATDCRMPTAEDVATWPDMPIPPDAAVGHDCRVHRYRKPRRTK